jgi:hypothetical protein
MKRPIANKNREKKERELARQKHIAKVLSRLKPYENLSILERYAIFMGKVQIVELLLKRTLADDRGYSIEKIEKVPLGGLIRILKEEKASKLFLFLLEDLNEFRNNMAHEFLADQVIMAALLKKKAGGFTKPLRHLEKSLFSVEQFLLNYESLGQKHLWKYE